MAFTLWIFCLVTSERGEILLARNKTRSMIYYTNTFFLSWMSIFHFIFFKLLLLFLPQVAVAWCGISVPRPGIEPGMQWSKCQILSTRQLPIKFFFIFGSGWHAEVPRSGINPSHSSDNAESWTARPPGNSNF